MLVVVLRFSAIDFNLLSVSYFLRISPSKKGYAPLLDIKIAY